MWLSKNAWVKSEEDYERLRRRSRRVAIVLLVVAAVVFLYGLAFILYFSPAAIF